ncbi:MAG: hypothetical protein ABSG93_11955 [Solirubrobacteraceae bacterium]
MDEAGNALTYNGSSWSAPTSIDGGRVLNSVSCPSSSFCVAVDRPGNALIYSGGAWSAPASIDGGDGLDSVSCPSASFCMAIGGDWPTNDGGTGALIYGGSSWSSATKIAIDQMSSVSCPSSSFCTAVGHEAEAVSYKAGSWRAPFTLGDSMDIFGVSCASESFCAAVGSFGDAFTYNGAAWSPRTEVAAATLRSVSCASAAFCVAVDEEGQALAYNGSVWSGAVTIDGRNDLSSVSCPEISFCAAVDYAGNALVYSTSPAVVPPASTPTTSSTGSTSSSAGTSDSSGAVGTSASAIAAALSGALNLKRPPTISGLLKTGSYNIGFTAPGPGQLSIQWSSPSAQASKHTSHAKPIIIATGSCGFSADGRGVVKLRLTAAGRKLLKKAKSLRVIEVATFKPNVGGTQTKQVTLTIRAGHSARR